MDECNKFALSIRQASHSRNNASHGTNSISLEQCKIDKNNVLSDLEEIRSKNIDLIRQLLHLLNKHKK